MPTKTKQNRKQLIKDRATAVAKTKKAPVAEAPSTDYDDAKADAYRLENEGKWAEATIAWGLAVDCATAEKDKKTAAGRKAAAKVRASAVAKSLEAQMEDQIAREEAARNEDEEADVHSEGDGEPNPEREGQDHYIRDNEEAEGDTRASTPEEMSAEAANERATETPPTTNGVSKRTRKPAEAAAPKERDTRLPPVGTIICKKDRTNAERARCTIVEDGVEYAGTTYKTLSAAGLKAMADLGLAAKTCDGFAFWGLKKGEPRAAKEVDFEQIEKAWDRYRERIEAAAMTGNADQRAKVNEMLGKHAETIMAAIRPQATPAAEKATKDAAQ